MASLSGFFRINERLFVNTALLTLATALGPLIFAASPDPDFRLWHVGSWSVPRNESVLLLDTSPFTLEYVKTIEYGGPESPSVKYASYDLGFVLLFADGKIYCTIKDVKEIKNLDEKQKRREKRRVRFPFTECNGHPAMELFPDTDMAFEGQTRFTKTIYLPQHQRNVLLTIGPRNENEQLEIRFQDEKGARVFCAYLLEPSTWSGTPWVSLCDLDGDGIDEVLVGQGNYGRWDIQIFSAKADNLDNLQNIFNRLRGLQDIPQDRIFSLKGKTVIWDLAKSVEGAPFPLLGSPK